MIAAAYFLLVPFGAVVGSFAATAGLRLSEGRGWSRGRSSCDHCLRPLAYADTVPIVSYARFSGRCSSCSGPIDPTHLVGEAAGALLLALAFAFTDYLTATLLSLLAMTLVTASTVDWKIRRLPDALTAATAVICLGLAATEGWPGIVGGLVASAVVAVVGVGLRWFSERKHGHPTLGLGDVKLAGGLAIWLGIETPIAIGLASVLALISIGLTKPADRRIAFGPFISAAAWAVGFLHMAGLWSMPS